MLADQELLAQLRGLELALRPSRASHRFGVHPLAFRGRSLEFAEYREYRPGDDLRDLDWKVWGRSDRYYLKQRDSHTPASVLLLLDDSPSMQVASNRSLLPKHQAMALLAFGLSYLLQGNGDLCALGALSQSFLTAPRASRRAFLHHVELLRSLARGEALQPPGALPRLKPRSFDHIFLLSDFLEPMPVWEERLRTLNQWGWQVNSVQVLDPLEANPLPEEAELEHAEGFGQRRRISKEDWTGYRRNWEVHQSHLEALSRKLGIRQRSFVTDEPITKAVRRILAG